MIRIALSSLSFCGLLIVCQTGEAQSVRVWPGGAVSVRAPFVSVDVGPYGGAHVHAPFTSVYAPGYPGAAPFFPFPFMPYGVVLHPPSVRAAEVDVAQLSLPELQSSLLAHWNALQRDLGRFATGAGWKRHLQLPAYMLTEHADPFVVANPRPGELQKVYEKYERVAATPEYQVISRLASFQTTRRLLAAYVARLSEASAVAPPAEELPTPAHAPAPVPAPIPTPAPTP